MENASEHLMRLMLQRGQSGPSEISSTDPLPASEPPMPPLTGLSPPPPATNPWEAKQLPGRELRPSESVSAQKLTLPSEDLHVIPSLMSPDEFRRFSRASIHQMRPVMTATDMQSNDNKERRQQSSSAGPVYNLVPGQAGRLNHMSPIPRVLSHPPVSYTSTAASEAISENLHHLTPISSILNIPPSPISNTNMSLFEPGLEPTITMSDYNHGLIPVDTEHSPLLDSAPAIQVQSSNTAIRVRESVESQSNPAEQPLPQEGVGRDGGQYIAQTPAP